MKYKLSQVLCPVNTDTCYVENWIHHKSTGVSIIANFHFSLGAGLVSKVINIIFWTSGTLLIKNKFAKLLSDVASLSNVTKTNKNIT